MRGQKKKRIGRPPRQPGHDFTLRDIPREDFCRFKAKCQREEMTMRARLLQLIEKDTRSLPKSTSVKKEKGARE